MFTQAHGTIIAMTDKLLSVLGEFSHKILGIPRLHRPLASGRKQHNPRCGTHRVAHLQGSFAADPSGTRAAHAWTRVARAACNPTSGIIYTLKLHV